MHGVLFTFSMWTVEELEFVIKSSDLKPGKQLLLSELNAYSIAGAYVAGVGRLTKGELIIELARRDRIEIRVSAPELSAKFQGLFTFRMHKTPDPISIDGFGNNAAGKRPPSEKNPKSTTRNSPSPLTHPHKRIHMR